MKVVTNCDHLEKLKYYKGLPNAFTEHGAIMLANVLKSERAIEMSIYVVRAFNKLRELISSHKVIAEKLTQLERRVSHHDEQIKTIIDAIRELMNKPKKNLRTIGFQSK